VLAVSLLAAVLALVALVGVCAGYVAARWLP
jgi:hypothetical protein